MRWYLMSPEGKVTANFEFEEGQWSQQGVTPEVWEDLKEGVGLDDESKVRASDGLSFLLGIRRVFEASGSKLIEGTKPLDEADELPEYDPDELESEGEGE